MLVIEREPRPAAWDMAWDEALLEDGLATGRCWVRWYRWARPTISLGYFQPSAAVLQWPDCDHVRRLSGGGAILHHHEITYSCVIPPSHPSASRPHQLYLDVHRLVQEGLARLGFATELRGTARPELAQALLCFERGDDFDLVCAGRKVLGSAQRRRKGAILQHGSLVLRASRFAPQIPGLCDLAGRDCIDTDVLEVLGPVVARALLGGSVLPGGGLVADVEFPSELRARAAQLAAEKYARLDWNVSGSPADEAPPDALAT